MTIIASDKFTANTPQLLSEVKHIVMVASGKGGVGKSTTAVNLALAAAATGAKVGLMDADIYGPSQQLMLGVAQGTRVELIDNTIMKPIIAHGIKLMTMGLLAADKSPMVWRGPMAVKAMQQMLEQTAWGALDYLFIDMPPGTGDIHISLAQRFPVAGAVVVTTPQEVALIDARKGIEMFAKVNIPVLGLIENMSSYTCENCGHSNHLFGNGGARQLQQEYSVKLLAEIPLNPKIGSDLETGRPTVVAMPDSEITSAYLSAVAHLAVQLQRTATQPSKVTEITFVD